MKKLINFNISFWYNKNHKDVYYALSGKYFQFIDKTTNKLDYYYNFDKVYIDGLLKSPEYLHKQFKKDFKFFDTFYAEVKKHFPDIDFTLERETSDEQTTKVVAEAAKE